MFDAGYIAYSVLGYSFSYVEIVATLFGLISVYLAARGSIYTWPAGIVNEIGFFLIFFQINLYADMLLQVYFFVVTLYGWFHWNNSGRGISVTKVSAVDRWCLVLAILVGSLLLGFIISNLHIYFDEYFTIPADYPFVDSFTTVVSIFAMVLLANKKLESWVLWIVVDIVSVALYWVKGVHLIAIEYLIFLFIALFGLLKWRKEIE
jgi:nicotinamide mononucleotide transporter